MFELKAVHTAMGSGSEWIEMPLGAKFANLQIRSSSFLGLFRSGVISTATTCEAVPHNSGSNELWHDECVVHWGLS